MGIIIHVPSSTSLLQPLCLNTNTDVSTTRFLFSGTKLRIPKPRSSHKNWYKTVYFSPIPLSLRNYSPDHHEQTATKVVEAQTGGKTCRDNGGCSQPMGKAVENSEEIIRSKEEQSSGIHHASSRKEEREIPNTKGKMEKKVAMICFRV